jgi:hypothetical protein
MTFSISKTENTEELTYPVQNSKVSPASDKIPKPPWIGLLALRNGVFATPDIIILT